MAGYSNMSINLPSPSVENAAHTAHFLLWSSRCRWRVVCASVHAYCNFPVRYILTKWIVNGIVPMQNWNISSKHSNRMAIATSRFSELSTTWGYNSLSRRHYICAQERIISFSPVQDDLAWKTEQPNQNRWYGLCEMVYTGQIWYFIETRVRIPSEYQSISQIIQLSTPALL